MLDELEAGGIRTRSLGVGRGIARSDHEDQVFNAGLQDLFGEDLQGGLRGAIPVNEGLEGEGPLMGTSGGDEGLLNLHRGKGCAGEFAHIRFVHVK